MIVCIASIRGHGYRRTPSVGWLQFKKIPPSKPPEVVLAYYTCWYGLAGLRCDERSCRTSVVQALTYIQDASTGVIKGNTAYALDLRHLWRTGQGLCSLRCRVVGIGLNGTTYNNTLLESNINSYPIIISRLPLFPLYHPSSTNNRRVPPFTGI